MVGPVENLVAIASDPICESVNRSIAKTDLRLSEEFVEQLAEMLKMKNGFYAFDNALHVFPLNSESVAIGLEEWNDLSFWKGRYGNTLNDIVFFSEDVFGVQFGLHGNRVIKFDPETGEINFFGEDLLIWASRILEEPDYEIGFAIATEWREKNGPIEPGMRLLPKIPFVLGGEYSVDNLHTIEAGQGMFFRADLWKQIKDLPDGSDVSIEVVDS